MIGQKFEGGIVIHAIAAEDNALVVTVDATEGWSGMRDQATDLLLGGLCTAPTAAVFFQSAVLRVDTLDRGADLRQGVPVNHCPEKSAQ